MHIVDFSHRNTLTHNIFIEVYYMVTALSNTPSKQMSKSRQIWYLFSIGLTFRAICQSNFMLGFNFVVFRLGFIVAFTPHSWLRYWRACASKLLYTGQSSTENHSLFSSEASFCIWLRRCVLAFMLRRWVLATEWPTSTCHIWASYSYELSNKTLLLLFKSGVQVNWAFMVWVRTWLSWCNKELKILFFI